MNNDYNVRGSTAAAFLLGIAGGMVFGYLTAPKKGEETRADIKDNFNNAKNSFMNKYNQSTNQAKSKLSDTVDMVKTVASDSKNAAIDSKRKVKEQQNSKNATKTEE